VEQRFPDVSLGQQCKSFRILTDGMWDINIQLVIEAQRKGITLCAFGFPASLASQPT